jgi:ABC-type spermidine/putrescine transport system permease subunit II
MLKKDSLSLGLILGLLAPILGFIAYYLLRFRIFSIKEFFQVLMMQKSLMSGIVSIALLANAIVFTIYINQHKDKTAKGIFIATCAYALIALGLKWFA